MTISEASVTAVDPRSGAELGHYPETPVGEVPAIVERAVAAFADPRLADHERRAAALRGGAELLRAYPTGVAVSWAMQQRDAPIPRPPSRTTRPSV